MNVAIAHKDYAVRGGGERLVEHLAEYFDAPLFVGGVESDVSLNYDDVRLVDATKKQRWMIHHGGWLQQLAYCVAWQNEDRLTEYDTIITSGNEPLWYVPEPEQTLIAYCHSPPRGLYDLNHGTGDGTLGALYRSAKRAWFQHNVTKPDLWVANSEIIKRRIQLYWDIPRGKISVVYPPVEVESFGPDNAPTGDYYLYLGRLAHHKRVGIPVEACERVGECLKVAGRGPAKESVESVAGENTNLLGYVGEGRKRELLAGAKALLMPAEREDFGIVPIEALASGTPVIGVNEGFTKHQINHGKNGYTCNATVDGFVKAMGRFDKDGVEWSPEEIRQEAIAKYAPEQFENGMEQAVIRAKEIAGHL